MAEGNTTSRADRELLREFYDRYAHQVFARCRYLLRDEEEARDAMHDVFIKAQKSLSSFREEASPLTWLTRIATNHCLNIIRAKNAQWHDKFRQEVATQAAAAPKESRGTRFAEEAQLLRLCLDRVDPKLAEIAVYYFVDEMTQSEICDLVGVSAPTLRKRLRAFIEQSRAEIAREVPGVEFRAAPI
jgi:RNA polymerase sigma-70 factor (ECF subfamily)